MEIKGCSKLTEANIIIVYGLSSEDPRIKTKFHDELYGRKKRGLLFRIPHRKLARGVLEIPQRNLREVRSVFDKYGVDYELRLTLPVRNSEQISKIARTIKDPYEESLRFKSLDFSKFVTTKLEDIGKGRLPDEELTDEILAINDTMQKWVKTHQEEPLATGVAYLFSSLENESSKDPEDVKRDASRIAASLKHWTIGYQVLEESEDTESIDEVLEKYRKSKK
jgi:hypothetical protein